MNSLVKVFSNFKEFYSEINGATLTGAIDVIVVEQPDGEYQCSPFHVRFGKLGVLRSREKVVDIEINGEPVDIHMKLGESGEAFFVEECQEEEVEQLPDNLATSPIPTGYFHGKYTEGKLLGENESSELKSKAASDDLQLPLPLPRRNSIDLSKEVAKEENEQKFENQVCDYSHRRYTDNVLERRNLSEKLKEYTTQKLRQEWAEHEEVFSLDVPDNKDWSNSTQTETKPSNADVGQNNKTAPLASEKEIEKEAENKRLKVSASCPNNSIENEKSEGSKLTPAPSSVSLRDESKGGKKKRRKKSQMKKKNSQRKSSSSSSLGSNPPVDGILIGKTNGQIIDEGDGLSISISNNSSNDEEANINAMSITTTKTIEHISKADKDAYVAAAAAAATSQITPTRIPDIDIHFFSDTEVTSSAGNNAGRGIGRPSTPIQSDSELEISLREKDSDAMTSSASWKWGELPTPEAIIESNDGHGGGQTQAQRNSMLSGMFNFMKRTNKMRKQVGEGGGVYLSDLEAEGMDPEMAALYFPNAIKKENSSTSNMEATTESAGAVNDDDRESGNGTSLPHSPSSMEGQKSIDSDYEDGGKAPEEGKYLDFVAMSLCGANNETGLPTDEEFDRHTIKYMDSAIEQLMNSGKQETAANLPVEKTDGDNAIQTKRSWWYWRRSHQDAPQPNMKNTDKFEKSLDEKDGDQTAVATTQTTRPNSPDVSDNTLSKTDSTLNAENTSAMVENLEDLSQASLKSDVCEVDGDKKNNSKGERFKKSLRLSSDAIKKLNLKEGVNEIEFSVTTAYQGTTRCKCYLFRWKHNDKVVISDIDGTITKSDVLGHILPMVGKDWAQLGVAQLFSKIEQNGYKLLYLSARAIGQSRATREYLRSIRQGDVKLPDGPLLLNPTSLISAFHREVIERKPEQFKIACLSDIRDLFPNKDPFYAGYGNRINDVWAYRAVGIPIMRIFTINTKGELKHELTQTFQSSGYINQSLAVDEHFPPITNDDDDCNGYIFDDDEEDELKFEDSNDDDDDDDIGGDDDDDNNEDYSDDYVDDIDDEGLIMNIDLKRSSTVAAQNELLFDLRI